MTEADRLLRERLRARTAAALAWACVAALATLSGCDSADRRASMLPGSDAERGRLLLRQFGCGACHRIPGVANAEGNVGPSLAKLGERVYLAGVIPNTPQNLVRWIVDPQAIEPLTAMPDLGVTVPQARDISAYLLSER